MELSTSHTQAASCTGTGGGGVSLGSQGGHHTEGTLIRVLEAGVRQAAQEQVQALMPREKTGHGQSQRPENQG